MSNAHRTVIAPGMCGQAQPASDVQKSHTLKLVEWAWVMGCTPQMSSRQFVEAYVRGNQGINAKSRADALVAADIAASIAQGPAETLAVARLQLRLGDKV